VKIKYVPIEKNPNGCFLKKKSGSKYEKKLYDLSECIYHSDKAFLIVYLHKKE
jgi:hypothetical protein